MDQKVIDAARAAFAPAGPAVTLGAVAHGGAIHPEPLVGIPLAMLNRHGLIAGATGTGKTKTLQLIAEQLSAQGVPVFLADVKGDLSGIGAAGSAHPKVDERAAATGYRWAPAAMPVEFLSLSGKRGAQLRATVSSFGPTRATTGGRSTKSCSCGPSPRPAPAPRPPRSRSCRTTSPSPRQRAWTRASE